MTTLNPSNKTDPFLFRTILGGALLFAMFIFSVNTASAETTICRQVTNLPFVINKPGNWCLKRSLITSAASGPAIAITKANVVLDFNGFHISSRSGATADSTGVLIDRKGNVRIHNGTVRGFRQGIVSNRANAVIIENMNILNNFENGINIKGGIGANVRKNFVSGTGGTTQVEDAAGIRSDSSASGVNIVDNSIEDTKQNSDESFGIRTTTNAVVIQNNRVTNSAEFGIFSSNNSAALVVGNNITNTAPGSIGIRLNANNTSIYKDNLVSGFNIAFSSGEDGGGNFGL